MPVKIFLKVIISSPLACYKKRAVSDMHENIFNPLSWLPLFCKYWDHQAVFKPLEGSTFKLRRCPGSVKKAPRISSLPFMRIIWLIRWDFFQYVIPATFGLDCPPILGSLTFSQKRSVRKPVWVCISAGIHSSAYPFFRTAGSEIDNVLFSTFYMPPCKSRRPFASLKGSFSVPIVLISLLLWINI